jgi:hypothetical protein
MLTVLLHYMPEGVGVIVFSTIIWYENITIDMCCCGKGWTRILPRNEV